MSGIAMSRRSEVGTRQRNEDFTLVGQAPFGWYAILSDGAGGHLDGARASMLVASTAEQVLRASDQLCAALVQQAIVSADLALKDQVQGKTGAQRMAATLVILAIERSGQRAVWGHVGDSRLYLVRRGGIAHVTRDDSVVQQMLEAGWIDADQARNHPRRSQLLAALGSEEPVNPNVLSQPWPLADGDAFLLCTDGWWDALPAGGLEHDLAHAASIDGWLDAMSARVAALADRNQDNFSAVAVWIGDPADVTRLVGSA